MAEKENVLTDKNGLEYKIHLCKTDIGQNSNKFYDMELFQKNKKEYAVKLINGRIGYKGLTNFKIFGDLEKAANFFETKFFEKTHLNWEEKDDEPVPGKYVVVKLANQKEIKKELEEAKCEPKINLRKRSGKVLKVKNEEEEKEEEDEKLKMCEKVRLLLKCICDEDVHLGMLKQLKFNENYGKPIDCLSLSQIELGYQILKDIEKIMTSKKANKNVTIETNQYYSLIPHSFGFTIPPKIDSVGKVQLEKELLDALKGTIEAAQSIRTLNETTSNRDIYHRLYDQLPCEIEPCEKEILELIEECLKFRAPTHMFSMNLVNAFKIVTESDKRMAPKKRKVGKSNNNNRVLLWHGTRVTNLFSILMKGLEIPEGPRGDLMFGNGVYFANVPSKSANYCFPENGKNVFMLLCEVDVTKPLVLYSSDVAAKELMEKQKKEFIFAAGRQTPKETVKINGVRIFKGKLENIEKESELLYDEYVFYKKEKFKIKYVVEVEMKKLKMEELLQF